MLLDSQREAGRQGGRREDETNEETTGPPPGAPPAWAAVRGLGPWKDVSENQDMPGPTLQVRDGEGALLQLSPETETGGGIRAPRYEREPPLILTKSSRGREGRGTGESGSWPGKLQPGLLQGISSLNVFWTPALSPISAPPLAAPHCPSHHLPPGHALLPGLHRLRDKSSRAGC